MDESTTVAEYILGEVKDVAFNNALYRMMLHEIESQIAAGSIPDHHYFLQQPDEEMKRIAMEVISSPYTLSENWNKMHDIFVTVPSENFKNDVISSLNHFKMKKVMMMMKENLRELKAIAGNQDDEKHYLLVHGKLTDWKKQLGKRMGTVVVS